MIRVVCPGPALDVTHLVDEVRLGGIARPREVIRLAGGKGLNLARAAAALGASVSTIAPLGGRIGELVADLAAAEGLQLEVVPVAGETRMCVSAISDDGGPTEFYEPSAAPTAAESAALVAAVAASEDETAAGWIAVCGRLPDTLPVEALARRLDDARAAGCRVAVDTSGPGLAALLTATTPDLVKVNRAEAAELLGPDESGLHGSGAEESAVDLARRLRARTRLAAIVTDGAAGAAAANSEGVWIAEPDPEPGRYAIGSGDSFLAGLLVALSDSRPMSEALALASAAGSANTRMPGAGRLDPRDVDAALSRIRVAAVPG